MRFPSGSRPGSDFTRDPVARITSVPWRTRSPPGLSASGVISTRTWVGPSRRPLPWIQVTLFLSIRLFSPVHSRLTTWSRRSAIAGVVERLGHRPRCRIPSHAGCARRRRRTRAAPSSGCSRCGGTCHRSWPGRRGRPSARAARRGMRRCSRQSRRRGRRDRSRWRSRRPSLRMVRRRPRSAHTGDVSSSAVRSISRAAR